MINEIFVCAIDLECRYIIIIKSHKQLSNHHKDLLFRA